MSRAVDKPKPREKRFQVVISLGVRTHGFENEQAIKRAASRAQLEVSTWSRRVLLAAAGMQDQEFATRQDVLALVDRLERVEDKLGIEPFPVLDPAERARRGR